MRFRKVTPRMFNGENKPTLAEESQAAFEIVESFIA
jgi:hypothetical protein